MSRQLIKIDTEEEALQYLSDSFRAKLYCDFVGVIFTEGDLFVPKAWSGSTQEAERFFPLEVDRCSTQLLRNSVHDKEVAFEEDCQLITLLKENGVKTWFTVPLKDEMKHYGFCIVGFLNYVPLLEMGKHFDEFGQDVAVAIAMTRRKEKQLKKIEGIEWISENLSIDSPFEESIAELTLRAGKGTNAESAFIYLYNEQENCFIFQPPSYGKMVGPDKLMIEHNYVLKEYFPFLEKIGGAQMTIPIAMDLKTIGVLHIEGKKEGFFSEDDLVILRLLSNHMATILENARLYNNEKEHRNRLRFLLDYQQALVKVTMKTDDFDGVTSMLGDLFNESVVLFDGFMRLISSKLKKETPGLIDWLKVEADRRKSQVNVFTVLGENGNIFSVWPISGGGNLLGYLAVQMHGNELDEYDQLTIEMALNVCSIQFIKQRLVLEAKEQSRDGFVSKLLVEKVENEESILQYANLFQWDLFRPHRVAMLSIALTNEEVDGFNLLEQEAKKTTVWGYIKALIADQNRDILTASFDDRYLLIVPADLKQATAHWDKLSAEIKKATMRSGVECQVLLGIGTKTETIHDYYTSCEQAGQALKIVESRLINQGYALFEELGSYTILHQLTDLKSVALFMNYQLEALRTYSEGNKMNLMQTLRVYLQNNGNAKGTAEELFLHRSSLLYRLEKIEELVGKDLNNAEVRFNLLMAFKLYDMQGQSYD